MHFSEKKKNFIRQKLGSEIGKMRHLKEVKDKEKAQNEKAGLGPSYESKNNEKYKKCKEFSQRQPNDWEPFKSIKAILLE